MDFDNLFSTKEFINSEHTYKEHYEKSYRLYKSTVKSSTTNEKRLIKQYLYHLHYTLKADLPYVYLSYYFQEFHKLEPHQQEAVVRYTIDRGYVKLCLNVAGYKSKVQKEEPIMKLKQPWEE